MQKRRIKPHKYRAALVATALVIALGQRAIAESEPAQTRARRVTASATASLKLQTSKSHAHKPQQSKAQESKAQESKPQENQPQESKPQEAAQPGSTPPPMSASDRLPFMASDERTDSTEQPSSLGMLARTFGALLLIIGLLIGSMWCLKRIKGSPFRDSREDGQLSVLKTVTLADRRSLTVARFGERILLIGSTPQSFTLLASDEPESLSPLPAEELPARSVADALGASESYRQYQEPSFADELGQLEEWR